MSLVRAAAQTNRFLLNALLAHNLRSREVCLPGLDFWRERRNTLPILRSPPNSVFIIVQLLRCQKNSPRSVIAPRSAGYYRVSFH